MTGQRDIVTAPLKAIGVHEPMDAVVTIEAAGPASRRRIYT